MTRPALMSACVAAIVVVASLLLVWPRVRHRVIPGIQTTSKTRNLPRLPDGHPDLQGIWDFATLTPLERPATFAGRMYLTPEETAAETRGDRLDAEDPKVNPDRAYNSWDRGRSTGRTSLIVDPADGRIPALTPDGLRRAAERAEARRRRGAFVSYETRPLGERCLVKPTAGPPMMPPGDTNIFQLIQAPGYVVIFNEQIHDARIVSMEGRPHLDTRIRRWMGDSRGRWDGETLVIDTTNFTDKTNFNGSSPDLHLTERFRRIAGDTLNYEFTIDDPATFTKTWTVAFPTRMIQGPIYEYACHEGNYSLRFALSGARSQEQKVSHHLSAR